MKTKEMAKNEMKTQSNRTEMALQTFICLPERCTHNAFEIF